MYHHTSIYEDITLACSVINVSSCIEKNFLLFYFSKIKQHRKGMEGVSIQSMNDILQ